MKNIAIVCGGNSGEYDISMQSGRVVEKQLDPARYTAFLIVIRKGDWYFESNTGEKHPIDKSGFSLNIEGGKVRFDGVFIAIHGTPGEDGKLQGYFDLLNIPYTSCGVAASALTFNKYFCNRFVSAFGIRVADSVSLRKGESFDLQKIVEQLGLPLFVKPSGSGSSVGISKVTETVELDKAIETAFMEDDRILIEAFMDGREIACGMIEKKGELIVFPLTEIISKNDFFDYEAKYTSDKADEITPADIPEEAELDIKTTSSFLYRQMDCRGFVRFDYILAEDGLYFLEVNAVPGITEASILPRQAAAFGMSIRELFTVAVEEMFSRGNA
ncbi:MAG: D-alanine--D-alanine ligase [Bacteroidales bacterium]|nr:D-alanine--D-alanine ligase [Bacteroidales bacterium]